MTKADQSMRPSLRQIEAFLAVAEDGSFTRAAERAGHSQPALSRTIRDLEALVGTRLILRTTRRVELTAAGRAFRDAAARAAEQVDRAVTAAQDAALLRQGLLRVAAPPLLAASVLPVAIAALAARHPGLRVELADVGTAEILARLRDGRADVGVGTIAAGEPGLDRRPLLRDRLMLFCLPGHALDRPGCGWDAAAAHPLVALTPGSDLRRLSDLGFARAGLAPRPAWEVAQIATALALVAAGLGVAVLPGSAAAAAGHLPLVRHDLAGAPVEREVALVRLRDRPAPPAAPALAAELLRAMRVMRAGAHPSG
jgi:DNA-binding transcriptional LysR family regulator